MSILKSKSSIAPEPEQERPRKRVRFSLQEDKTEIQEPLGLSAAQIAYRRNVLASKELFLYDYGMPLSLDADTLSSTMALKVHHSYSDVVDHPLSKVLEKGERKRTQSNGKNSQSSQQPAAKRAKHSQISSNKLSKQQNNQIKRPDPVANAMDLNQTEIVIESAMHSLSTQSSRTVAVSAPKSSARELEIQRKRSIRNRKPEWKRPWKLYRVISGHMGWVQCAAVDGSNEWFCTGSADRTIKIWNLASGALKLTLTGHISAVRGLAVSRTHSYLFSCAEDKKVCCWDLETNRVIRHYHGHLSGVYTLALHPGMDIFFTGGRDSTVRVWDIRTKAQIMVLSGHKHTVNTVRAQKHAPQVISGSMDRTVRTWDLKTQKTLTVLTNHKKAIRSVAIHPVEYSFISGAADNLKVWKCPNAVFMRNMNEPPRSIIESIAINEDNVLVSGHQNGRLMFWDYKTGHKMQDVESPPQPGSLDAEASINQVMFDMTGTRIITTESDKTVKLWKPDQDATPETHPLDLSKFQLQKNRKRF